MTKHQHLFDAYNNNMLKSILEDDTSIVQKTKVYDEAFNQPLKSN